MKCLSVVIKIKFIKPSQTHTVKNISGRARDSHKFKFKARSVYN